MKPLLIALLVATTVFAQGPPSMSSPTFDVISVKQNRSGDPNSSLRRQAGGGMTATNTTLLCGTTRARLGDMVANGVLMTDFVRNLSPAAGRLIVDETGLMGGYDFTLTWTDEGRSGPGSVSGDRSPDAGPSLFTAMREQLGLKLEPRRGPVEVLVVDRAEPPAEN